MSDGFAGSSTKGINSVQKEIELRLKRLDIFTDEKKPRGSGDQVTAEDAEYFSDHKTVIEELKKMSESINKQVEKKLARLARWVKATSMYGCDIFISGSDRAFKVVIKTQGLPDHAIDKTYPTEVSAVQAGKQVVEGWKDDELI